MNITNKHYEEKRNFIRMKVDAPVAINCPSLEIETTGICRNLSGGGLLVELGSTLPMGTRVNLSISSQHGHNPMLKARAEVNRVNSSLGKKESPCLLGLQIVEML